MKHSQDKSRKFTIQERLNNLPWKSRPTARKEIQQLLDVSRTTLHRILTAEPGDKQDISSSNLIKIANYFNVKPEEILTQHQSISIGSLILTR